MAPRTIGTIWLVCSIAALAACSPSADDGTPTDVVREDAEAGEGVEGLDGDGDGPSDADVVCPGVPELCNGIDDDCDRMTDEDFDLSTDATNCGECGVLCAPIHAAGGCVDGYCRVSACDPGWVDANGAAVDGCEYECNPTGEESTAAANCGDLLDNDCDGRTDATDGSCSSCFPELCNAADDDCDGLVDEEFDTDFDALNCGACGRACPDLPNGVPSCVLATCEFYCEGGWADLDGLRWNGCESLCVPTADTTEAACNGVDNNCDGRTDEDFVPTSCGEGVCRRDSFCHRSTVDCIPRTPPAPTDTTCDRTDDDCDGRTDEDADCRCYTDAECDDGDVCSGVETCTTGVACNPGTPVDCSDDYECTTDGCIALDGTCFHLPVHAGCSDGDACNGIETCDPTAGCVAGTPVNCDDGVACTTDTCDPATGTCSNAPVDRACDDGTFCNGDEVCHATRGCLPGPAPSCSDGVACTDDACNPTSDSCVNTPIDSRCDDGLACTTDTCDSAGAGGAGRCLNTPPDGDGDTYPPLSCLGTDCNDADAAIRPGAAERCNAVDDDCDTSTDETFACIRSSTGSCTVGTCAGSRICSSSCVWGTCTVSASETCNGLDDTCNGVADEGFTCVGGTTRSCTVTRPTKTCTGTQTCSIPGCTWGACVVPQTGSYAEVCNAIDDDCDTSVDEAPPSPLTLCATVANATWSCNASGICVIASCSSGWADTDVTYSTGCECAVESPDAPQTCGEALAAPFGTLTDSPTSSRTITGKITSDTDIDCFSFSGSDVAETNTDSLNVDIRFRIPASDNPGTRYAFSVWRGTCTTAVCAGETSTYTWRTDVWPTCTNNPTGTDPPCGELYCNYAGYNVCTNNTANYTFCVSRPSAASRPCEQYTITVTNGYY